MHPILFCLQEYPLWSFFYGSDHFYVGWYFVFPLGPLAKMKEILRTFLHQNNCANITAVWEKNLNNLEILSHFTSARGEKMFMKNVRAWVSMIYTALPRPTLSLCPQKT